MYQRKKYFRSTKVKMGTRVLTDREKKILKRTRSVNISWIQTLFQCILKFLNFGLSTKLGRGESGRSNWVKVEGPKVEGPGLEWTVKNGIKWTVQNNDEFQNPTFLESIGVKFESNRWRYRTKRAWIRNRHFNVLIESIFWLILTGKGQFWAIMTCNFEMI